MTRFPVTRLVYANVYTGVTFDREHEPTFMVSILDSELPAELREFAREPRLVKDEMLLAISAGKFAPIVVMEEGRNGASHLSTILRTRTLICRLRVSGPTWRFSGLMA